MMREKIVPRKLGVDANGNSIVLVGADVRVESVGFTFGKVRADLIEERVKNRRIYCLVGVAPVDVLLARRLFDEKLVFGRASGMRTRIDDQLPVAANDAFAAANGMLDELGNA